MSYRQDVEALALRCAALETQASANAEALREARVLLAEAEAKRRLPLLDRVRVAAPCPKKWSEMVGDAHTRHCGECNENVYNLSSLTREQAEALILEKEGKLCVQFYRRADGTILTADCPDGVKRRRRKRRVMATAFSALSAVSAAAALSSGNRPVPPMRTASDLRPIPRQALVLPPTSSAAAKKKAKTPGLIKGKYSVAAETVGAIGGGLSLAPDGVVTSRSRTK